MRDLAPSTLILLRMGSGALALAVYIKATGRDFGALLPYAWPLALLGLVNTAVPFFLIAWGQQYIDSGLAAILNASAPLFTALFAVALRPEPARDRECVSPASSSASAASSCSSASSSRAASEPSSAASPWSPRPPATDSAASMRAVASPACRHRSSRLGRSSGRPLFVLPFGVAQASSLGWEALVSVLYLGVAATGVAYLLYFGLIAGAGASKAVLVTYLVPSLALVYGAVFLDEEVTALSIAGLALVLAGVALGTGSVKR